MVSKYFLYEILINYKEKRRNSRVEKTGKKRKSHKNFERGAEVLKFYILGSKNLDNDITVTLFILTSW